MDREAVLVLRDPAFERLHGEPLHAHALRALVEAVGPATVLLDERDLERARRELPDGVRVTTAWTSPGPVVVHDACCPLVDAAFIAGLGARADATPGTALVAVRPVTDTLKVVVGDRIEGTVDRAGLVTVASPVVLPAADGAPLTDLVRLLVWLRERGQVELVEAPSLGRRVEDAAAVHLLEARADLSAR